MGTIGSRKLRGAVMPGYWQLGWGGIQNGGVSLPLSQPFKRQPRLGVPMSMAGARSHALGALQRSGQPSACM